MVKPFNLLNNLRFLSIEVVLNALAVGLFAVKWLQTNPPMAWWPILASSVWIIYTTDHLIDANQLKEKATIKRHLFHHNHFKWILWVLFLLSSINLTLIVIFFDKQIIVGGLLLASFAVVYLVTLFLKKNLNRSIPKEGIVAFIFVAGIWFVPLLLTEHPVDLPTVGVIVVFLGLAFTEGAMVSWFEYAQDTIDLHTSFAIRFGKVRSQRMLIAFLVIGLIIVAILFHFCCRRIEVVGVLLQFLMALNLLLVMLKPRLFESYNLYRIIGDGVFMLPAILYLIQ